LDGQNKQPNQFEITNEPLRQVRYRREKSEWSDARSRNYPDLFWLAWQGNDGRINIQQLWYDPSHPTTCTNNGNFSEDFPYRFVGKVVTPYVTQSRPALVYDGSGLVLAWRDANNRINVARAADSGGPQYTNFSSVWVSTETTDVGPSIAAFSNVTKILWKGFGTSSNYVNIMDLANRTVPNAGYVNKVTLQERTLFTPSMAYKPNETYYATIISWVGTNNKINVMTRAVSPGENNLKFTGDNVTAFGTSMLDDRYVSGRYDDDSQLMSVTATQNMALYDVNWWQ
jgi:hypothetical protein